MTCIRNTWTDPFWTDFSKVPYHRDFTPEDSDSAVYVCRAGFDIGINLEDQGCVYLDLFDAKFLYRCLAKAVEDADAARQESVRYFRETSAAELKKKKEQLPQTLEALQKEAKAIAACLKLLQTEAVHSINVDVMAKELPKKAEALKAKLDDLRRTLEDLQYNK